MLTLWSGWFSGYGGWYSITKDLHRPAKVTDYEPEGPAFLGPESPLWESVWQRTDLLAGMPEPWENGDYVLTAPYAAVWREERQDYLTMLQNGEVVLELFTKPNAPARPTQPEALGLRHLAFRVSDITAAVRELEEKGIPCEPVRTDPATGCRFTFFRDPDGLPLELYENQG